MEQRKTYTPINLKHSFYTVKDGNRRVEFVSAVLRAVISPNPKVSPTATTKNGKPVIEFVTPVKNRGGLIRNWFGVAPIEKEDRNGNPTFWVRVSAWESVADRLGKLVAKHPNCVVIVIGKMEVTEGTDDEGNPRVYVNVTADDFWFIRDIGNKGTDAASTGGEAQIPEAKASSTDSSSSFSTPGFEELDDEEEDGELPF